MKKPDVKIDLVLVTPIIAKEWLKQNINNRPISKSRVSAYAGMMKAGKWTENGVIEFGADGELYDGQTRLQAVVESGVSVWFTVKYGITAQARANIDLGRARTAGNWLTMIGIPNGNRVAAALKLIYRIENGTIGNRNTRIGEKELFTPEMAERMAEEKPDVIEWTSFKNIKKCPKGLTTATLGAFSYMFSQKDANLAREFVAGMIDGFEKTKFPAFHKFREIVVRQPTNPKPYPANYLQAFMVIAWNYERAGTEPKLFRWIPTSQDFPKIQ